MRAKYLLKLIPSRIRITRTVTYEIVWCEDFLNDKKQLGECWFEGKQIKINKNQSPTETFKTFIHEALHAIQFEYPELKLTHSQIYKLEEILFRILKLNKILDYFNK
jgi:hypothetical protein